MGVTTGVAVFALKLPGGKEITLPSMANSVPSVGSPYSSRTSRVPIVPAKRMFAVL